MIVEHGDADAPLRSAIRPGDPYEDRVGRIWTFRSVDPSGLWTFVSGKRMLRLPGEDGIPRKPDEAAVRRAIRLGDLRRVDKPLEKSIRRTGRNRGRSKDVVLEADPKAALRMLTCRRWDADVRLGRRPSLDPASLEAWFDTAFKAEPLVAEFGKPGAFAIRDWVLTRGRSGDRRWCDMEDLKGQGERRKRIRGFSHQLALWHATRCFSRRTLNVACAHRALRRDFKRATSGRPLKMDGFAPVQHDLTGLKLMDETTFRKTCKRLDVAANAARRTSRDFVRSRRGGDGASIEAVRFGELVQMDEKESSAYVLVDERRRIPLGSVTTSIAVDCATTFIGGEYVGWKPPSTATAIQTLIAFGSLKDVPELFRGDFPGLETAATVISGLLVDNASHFVGETIQDLGGDLVMDILWAGDRTGTHKALAESRHLIVRRLVDDRLPSHKLPIAIARDHGIDLAGRAAIDIETYRRLFALAVAEYNITRRTDLGNRSPLELVMADQRRYGMQLPSDLEQFERAHGTVEFNRVLSGEGVVVNGLVYAHEREHQRLLDDFVRTSADRRRTKKLRFDAKIRTYGKVDRISIFNPRLGRYEDLHCKRRRYATDLTLETHQIISLGLPDGFDGVSEDRLLELRGQVEDAIEQADPRALADAEETHLRVLSEPAAMALAADRAEVVYRPPSPTGMEIVRHDLNVGRGDAETKPVRRRRGSSENDLNPRGTDADGRSGSYGAASQPDDHEEPSPFDVY